MNLSTDAPLLGAVLAERYELIRHLARGGMSDVYEGRDRLLQRQVAVKVYRVGAPADRGRFEAEILTLAALHHPGLVQVYDAGEHGDDGFVVLELVDGPSLRSVLDARGALPAVEVAGLGVALADALAFVHAAGVVHRDVTPSNVLCGRDARVRLADFGIARLLDTSRVTASATALGTAAYMAPEQVQGHDVTPAADMYSLALVLVEALTGHTAFTGTSYEVAVARVVRDPDIGADVPEAWRPLLREMTSREPEHRPPAEAVRARLEALEGTDHDAPSAALPPAAVVGAGVVDSHAATEVVAVSGGTTVMPAVQLPEPPSASPPDREHPNRRGLWLALLAVAFVLALIASQGGGGLEAPPPTTDPVEVTVPPSSSTVPPTTTEPPSENRGKGKGNDKDRGKGDDD
jgi:serine/threonine protein kinase